MTPEKQRIAIAQASQGAIEFYEGVWRYFDGKRLQTCKDNDPLQDLNAMHEAEKIFDATELNHYENELALLCNLKVAKSMASAFRWHATAAQRAEAFLKTLNLWKP